MHIHATFCQRCQLVNPVIAIANILVPHAMGPQLFHCHNPGAGSCCQRTWPVGSCGEAFEIGTLICRNIETKVIEKLRNRFLL